MGSRFSLSVSLPLCSCVYVSVCVRVCVNVCVCVCVCVYSFLDGVFIRDSACTFLSPVDPPPPPSPPILSLLSTSREGETFLWGVSMSRTCQMQKEFMNIYACMHMCMRACRQTDRQTDQMYTDINV